MTDRSDTLSAQYPLPSQTTLAVPAAPTVKEEVPQKVETVEEEPYTIKCICNFSDDDGNTIYCETCDTWQHIDCFYPDNREEAIREDFAHSCAECKPRPLNRQQAIERTLQLKHAVFPGGPSEKKTKRPPSKSHKKKTKPSEVQVNGTAIDYGKQASNGDNAPPPKKTKSSHRPSQSISSQPSKRSPSYNQHRSNPTHPPSPATSPPDLPQDFQIHHYSQGFCSLYNGQTVPDTENNAFASLAIPTALARWLREPETMKQEVGRTHSDVFQNAPIDIDAKKPKLEVEDATRTIEPGTVLRWRFLKSTASVEKDVPLIELNGEIGFQKDYCSEPDNLWADISSPLPFVFFHPVLPLYIDTRKEGSLARYVRRSCKPNAQLDTVLSDGSEYHFWLVSDQHIAANEQITLPWDFRLEKTVGSRWLHLLGLNDDDSASQDEPEMDHQEYIAISNWIDRILSEYGGCACELENNCAFARFHRHYLHGKGQSRPSGSKKKQRKPRNQTISPTSTGHPSRAASEGHGDEVQDVDGQSQSESSRSKPSSRDPTPLRQGSFDQLGILTEPTDRDKRKVAMVEDSFRRMEQQQPPRKKKRVSDGTTSSSKSKQRTGSSSNGQYVDAGAGGSKSGSPASAHSPQFSSYQSQSRGQSGAQRSRQPSANPRPVYCDAAVQTDPVEGEWFSTPPPMTRPKRRVISLAKRLLDTRQKLRADEQRQKTQSPTSRSVSSAAMEVDTALASSIPAVASETKSAPSPPEDVPMADAEPTQPPIDDTAAPCGKTKTTPDLRVQMPPVPAFEDAAALQSTATTPLSVGSSMVQSPLSSTSLPTPLGPPSVNGFAAAQPSPAKKKLSLSDYTRRSKAAGKGSAGANILKATLPSPEESKAEIVLENTPAVKSEDVIVNNLSSTPTTNGHS